MLTLLQHFRYYTLMQGNLSTGWQMRVYEIGWAPTPSFRAAPSAKTAGSKPVLSYTWLKQLSWTARALRQTCTKLQGSHSPWLERWNGPSRRRPDVRCEHPKPRAAYSRGSQPSVHRPRTRADFTRAGFHQAPLSNLGVLASKALGVWPLRSSLQSARTCRSGSYTVGVLISVRSCTMMYLMNRETC
jgi:hypothetical protein